MTGYIALPRGHRMIEIRVRFVVSGARPIPQNTIPADFGYMVLEYRETPFAAPDDAQWIQAKVEVE